MPIKPKPFERMTLDEEKKKRDQFTIEPDSELRKLLNHTKKIWDVPSDSIVIKKLAKIGYNAMIRTLDDQDWKFITRKNRARLSEKR